jgi:predicted membrane channel-forming protein YqfA (hemolysin III family)
MNKNALQLYPVWSNFIFAISGIYSIISSISKNKAKAVLLSIFGILLLLTGAFSVVYHINTPSWIGRPVETEEYKTWMIVDQVFAITTTTFAVLIFLICLGITWFSKKSPKLFLTFLLYDPNFYFTLLFLSLSITFFSIASDHGESAIDCKKNKCFNKNIDSYDIFHSNWHIMTALTSIFFITMINDYFKMSSSNVNGIKK